MSFPEKFKVSTWSFGLCGGLFSYYDALLFGVFWTNSDAFNTAYKAFFHTVNNMIKCAF